MTVKVGAHRVANDPGCLPVERIGLVTNHSAMTIAFGSSIDLFDRQGRLAALFGPEHGVRGDVQAGKKVAGELDLRTGVPVHSLYGETKKPTAEMVQGLDALVFDLQDAGSRFYTYIYTLLYVLQAAAEHAIPVYVLDRPNPLGGEQVEGNILDPALQSFVGYPLPIRHGLTIGELARFFVVREQLDVDLTVIPMTGWQGNEYFPELDLPWIPPSPNIPTWETALLYPGTCLFEGTNMSEGRGTTLPFHVLGAPGVDGASWAAEMNAKELPGIWFRPTSFSPTFSKHEGQLCTGIQGHVLEPKVLEPVRVGIELVFAAPQFHPDWAWIEPPAGRQHFIDLLAGTTCLREMVSAQVDPQALLADWEQQAEGFAQEREQWFLYSRSSDGDRTRRSEI